MSEYEPIGGEEEDQRVVEESSSSGNLLAGALILVVGALLTVTGIGAILGMPMIALGFAVMFPRFTKWAVVLAVLLVIAALFLL